MMEQSGGMLFTIMYTIMTRTPVLHAQHNRVRDKDAAEDILEDLLLRPRLGFLLHRITHMTSRRHDESSHLVHK